MNILTNRIAGLTPEKRLLLELLKNGRRNSLDSSTAGVSPGEKSSGQFLDRQNIVELGGPDDSVRTEPFSLVLSEDRRRMPADLEDAYPLSRIQLGMLTHMELRKNSPMPPAYHNVNSFRLRTPFDESALQEAVSMVVARHPTLRTSFDLASYSEPLQLVHKRVDLKVETQDLRRLGEAEQELVLKEFIERENYRLFDLTRPPLLKYFIHRLTDDTFQFTLVEPHSISDGWSTHLTLAEICNRYHELIAGQPVRNEPPYAVSFRDFVFMERKMVESEEARRFWHDKLKSASLTMLPRWPASYLRASAIDDHKHAMVIPTAIGEGLNRLAQLVGAPLKSVLLAAHFKVMSLVTGRSDVNTGVVFNGRLETPDGDLVRGLFLNTLPLTFVLGDGTWIDLTRDAYQAEVEAIPYRRYPLGELQKGHGGRPLFDAAFSYLRFHSMADTIGKVEDLGHGSDLSVTNFPLMVTFHASVVSASRLILALEFDVNEFCREQIKRICSYYESVLTSMSSDPYLRHNARCFLPARERRQIEGWSGARADYSADLPFHRVFETQAGLTPDAVALVSPETSMTYRELNDRANRLAHHLRECGAGPDRPVAIFLERSPEMLVAVLGVLKAGSAYLPLDTEYPKERLAFILDDAQAPIILSQSRLTALLPVSRARLVCLDSDSPDISHKSAANPTYETSPDHLVYIIYTSGSTGLPKGVMITHRGLMNYLTWCVKEYRVAEGLGALMHSSISFDLTVTSIFAPLMAGRSVILAPNLGAATSLGNALSEGWDFSLIKLTPSHLSLLNQEVLSRKPVCNVRAMIIGGEALTSEMLSTWRSVSPHTRLINEYGPTETVVGCVVYEAPPDSSGTGLIPIGFPTANTRVYALDRNSHPAPVQTPGELYIGGPGVARGYLNRADLTAERFIPNAFAEQGGERLYRTGDMVRYLPDGKLEFLGRKDLQVKVRGYRIELGEVETALVAHKGVKDAVVAVRDARGGERRLVGYIVADEREPATAFQLKQFLREKLPEYEIPVGFVFLPELPLTPNGKVNREALPEDEPLELSGHGLYEAPRNAVEELIADIWSEVLNVGRVSVKDNFHEIGGHSLAAFRLVNRLRRAFGVNLPVSAVFEKGTVAELGRLIETDLKNSQRGEPLKPVSRKGEAPLSYAQQGLWFVDRMLKDTWSYNIPAAVRVKGDLNIEALQEVVDELIERHESLRTSFPSIDGKPRQLIAGSRTVKIDVLDLRNTPARRREEAATREIMQEVTRPFDLAEGPLMRVKALIIGEGDQIIVVTLHHIVSDAWSMRVMARELVKIYQAKVEGRPSGLKKLEVQYADYAVWQRRRLESGELERDLSYWKKRLDNVQATEVKPDHPRGVAQSYRGATLEIRVPAERVAKLRRIGQKCDATLFMALLAGWTALLNELTGRDEIVVGTNVANREVEETEGMIGLFVNQVALRTDLRGDLRFNELLGRVRRICLEAYTHSAAPFEKVVEALGVKREANRSPIFQIKVDYGRAQREECELEGVSFGAVNLEFGAAHFDLTLYLEEGEDELRVALQYNCDLYEAESIEQILSKFDGVLAYVEENHEMTITEIVERLQCRHKLLMEGRKKAQKGVNLKRLKEAKREGIAILDR